MFRRTMLYAVMLLTFALVMYTIHTTAEYFVAINLPITLLVGFGILISIAIFFDRKDGYY